MIHLGDKKNNKGREYWTFSVEIRFGLTDFKARSTGWRYFPSSGQVKPPATKMSGGWAPTILDISAQALSVLASAVAAKLGHKGEVVSQLDEYFPLFETDRVALKRSHPKLYRDIFIEYGARHSDEPEAWHTLFERLPEGRLWPDILLEDTLDALVKKQISTEDLTADVAAGIISQEDYEFILDLLKKELVKGLA